MESEKIMRELLKLYRFYKNRKVMLERRCAYLQSLIENEGDDFERIFKCTLDEYLNKTKDEIVTELHNINIEIQKKTYLMEKVDLALAMAADYDEKYKLIIESFYIKNIRMEDISDSMHISRSSCYEIKNKAISYMAKVIFGTTI